MKTSMLRSVSLLALASAALSAHSAQFNLSYDVGLVTATLLITADPISGSPGQFHITGISGTRGAQAVTGFAAGGPSQFNAYIFYLDNVLYDPASPFYVNDAGFAYTIGTTAYNFCTQFGYYNELDSTGTRLTATNVALSSVPGPAAALPFALMALRRRKRA